MDQAIETNPPICQWIKSMKWKQSKLVTFASKMSKENVVRNDKLVAAIDNNNFNSQ